MLHSLPIGYYDAVGKWAYLGLCFVLVAGCESETGLIFEVTAEESVSEAPDELVFYVGASVETLRGNYVDDLRKCEGSCQDGEFGSDSRADVKGRDLESNPFRLLVRPSTKTDVEVMVAVIGRIEGRSVAFGATEAPVRFEAGEVRLWQVPLGDVPSDLDVSEFGCLSWSSGGPRIRIGAGDDKDCDGVPEGPDLDCDDLDPTRSPRMSEVCGNGVDDNCKDGIDEVTDEDDDGFTNCEECDDKRRDVNPDAEEVCDGVDNNCDGFCDEGAFDSDNDSYTVCGSLRKDDGSCEEGLDFTDCDDQNEFVHPGKEEICDGLDNDCNGVCDDHGGDLDKDGDGFTECGSVVGRCGVSEDSKDCDDDNEAVYPGAFEYCDDVDNDCDGEKPTSVPCYEFIDADVCSLGQATCNPSTGTTEACATNAEEIVSSGVCEIVDGCGEDDPLLCLFEQTVTPSVCQATYVDGVLCPGAAVPLPTGAGDCGWSLMSGSTAGDFLVGLRVPGGDTSGANTLAGCMAELALDELASPPTIPGEAYVRRIDGAGQVLYRIHLSAVQVAACSEDSVTCKTLPVQTP